MPDTLTPEQRSARMALIRGSGTKLEERLYSLLRIAVGPRRRIDRQVSDLPGKPDMTIPSLRVAIFAHGCFWHRCPIHARTPKSRVEFWSAKLDANQRRDRTTARKLRALGWSVWTVWEHDLTASRASRTTARLARGVSRRVAELRTAST